MKVVDYKDFEAISPIFKGEKGYKRAELLMRIFSLDKVNKVYKNSIEFTGAKFTSSLLNDLGIKYIIGNVERLKFLPKEGPFITISNHPYGGLDGIILVDLIAAIRPDFKLMVNNILAKVKTMKDNFIPVIPVSNEKIGITRANLDGIRETIRHLYNGHPVGFFPSGAVSDFRLKNFRVRDRQWQKSIIRIIKSAKVPVIPISFFDTNSPFFYFLGLINWKVRNLRLPSELFNKKGQKPRIGIGKIIYVDEQEQYKDIDTFGEFLREAVYNMPLPSSFTPRNMLNIAEYQFD
ncbi:MAG: lysophospholipid acyltransferase family protein [Bacteroidales bacterium]|nr:lysophospholipid acyltransferase family protein [Bacteroidales bacterium]